MAALQYLLTLPKTSARLVRVGAVIVEYGGILGSNRKVWNLSPTLEVWDSNMGFIRTWVLQLKQLAFFVWFSSGSYQNHLYKLNITNK